MTRRFQFEPVLTHPATEDPEQAYNPTSSSDADFYEPPPTPQPEPEDEESEPPQIPAAQFILKHMVPQAVAPVLLFETPLMVLEITQMFLLRWGIGHLALPLLFPVFRSEAFAVAHSFDCRPLDLFLGSNGADTFECWTLWTQFETIVLYPGLQESLFFRNDEPVTLACWITSLTLSEFLAAMHPLTPLTTAPLVPGDSAQSHQTVAVPTTHIVPGKPNFELTDPDDPRLTAVDTITDVTEGLPALAGVIQIKKVYQCTISGCTHKSTTASNRKMHEKTHGPPEFACPKIICARKSQVEKERSGTDCLPECGRNPCGGLVCPKAFTQNCSLERHESEHHTLVPLLRCPVETCEMRAKRHGKKCGEHGCKVKRLKASS